MCSSSAPAAPTTATQYNTSIPEYAKPYVTNMLESTQQQLFNMDADKGITGFKPYKPYSTNMNDYSAGFSPMQQQAFQSLQGMQPNAATNAGIMGATNAMQQAAQYGNYQPQQFGNQFQGQNFNNMGLGYQSTQNPNLQNFQMQGPQNVRGVRTQAAQLDAAPTYGGTQFQGPQGVGAERVGTQNFNNPATAQSYMNPYMQNVVDIQQREAQRTADIARTGRNAQASRAGAFGGSRQAIENAEAASNLATQKGDIQAQGLNTAYNQAQQAFQTDQARQLQAQQANQQTGLQADMSNQQMGYNTNLQNAQLRQQTGLSNQQMAGQYGLQQGQFGQAANLANQQTQQQANLANQQMGYNVGNTNLQSRLGVQQLGSGQNMQSQLANQQAYGQMQGLGMQQNLAGNAQAMQNAQLAAQYGLAGQQAGEQSRQFGSNLGLQGLQQQLAASGQLGLLGQQQYAQQMGINAAQQAAGGQQQTAEQNKINQAIQNYATQQQYPMMQLGMMSNMLRGLPMQSTTTQSYQAMPSTAQQLIGAAGTLGSTYQAFNPTPKKEGGVIKGLAHGGSVNSYAIGGEVKQQLSLMSDEQLQRVIQTSTSNEIRAMAGQILAEHKMAEQMTKNSGAEQGLMAASTGNTFDNMAGGGIIAFEEGSKEAIKNPEENYVWNPITRRNEPVQGRTETPMSDATREATAGLPVQKPANVGSQDLNTIIRGLQQSRTETGVAGAPRQAEKESIEKRLAGLDAQEYTQNKLMQAQFFANLGTTPGGLLQGGLRSAAETMPKLAQLRADQLKIRDNYANIQTNIAEADRLEKLGLVKEAEAIRERSVKEEGENNRANAANARALEVANIGRESQRYVADTDAATKRAIANTKAGKEKIDEIAFAAAAKTVAAEMSITEGKPVSPQDPRVLVEAYRRLSSIKGLTGPKLEAAQSDSYATRLENAYKNNKPLAMVETQLSLAKEGTPKYNNLIRTQQRLMLEMEERVQKSMPKTVSTSSNSAIPLQSGDLMNRLAPDGTRPTRVPNPTEDNAVNTSNPLLAK